MVARDTVMSWWWARCHPMVSGPESSRVAVSLCRSPRIRSTTSLGIAVGEDCESPGQCQPDQRACSDLRKRESGPVLSLEPEGPIPHLFPNYSRRPRSRTGRRACATPAAIAGLEM